MKLISRLYWLFKRERKKNSYGSRNINQEKKENILVVRSENNIKLEMQKINQRIKVTQTINRVEVIFCLGFVKFLEKNERMELKSISIKHQIG